MARILVGTELALDRWPVVAASRHTNEGADRQVPTEHAAIQRATTEDVARAWTAERATNRLKNFHAVTTGHEKRGCVFPGTSSLTAPRRRTSVGRRDGYRYRPRDT